MPCIQISVIDTLSCVIDALKFTSRVSYKQIPHTCEDYLYKSLWFICTLDTVKLKNKMRSCLVTFTFNNPDIPLWHRVKFRVSCLYTCQLKLCGEIGVSKSYVYNGMFYCQHVQLHGRITQTTKSVLFYVLERVILCSRASY